MTPPAPGQSQSTQIAAAASYDLNDELTIILCGIGLLLAHPSELDRKTLGLLVDVQKAACTCAAKSAALLAHSVRKGARPSAAPLESLL